MFLIFYSIALHHKKIKNHPERISRIHHYFCFDYNWEGIEFPVGIKDWKRFEKNNKTIALNIFSVPHDEKKIMRINQNIMVNVKIR